jgi:chorismate mutase-like protein
VPTTWKTLLADASADRFDIAVGGISVTPERERAVKFSSSYTRDYKTPVTRCGEEGRYDSVAEINQPTVRMVVNAGGTNEGFARATFPLAKLSVRDDNRTVFDLISAGQADVMVTDAVEARLQQQRGRSLCMAKRAPHWIPADKAILIAPDPQFKAALDHAMAQMRGKKVFAQSLDRWLEAAAQSSDTKDDARTRLARLIDLRLEVVAEVARSKWNSGAAIEDLPRERLLLQSLQAQAQPLGITPTRVNEFFGAQILAAKQLQSALFDRWRKQRLGKFVGVSDLAAVLRPKLDVLTAKMLAELAVADRQPQSHTRQELTFYSVSAVAARTALQPLTNAAGTSTMPQGLK